MAVQKVLPRVFRDMIDRLAGPSWCGNNFLQQLHGCSSTRKIKILVLNEHVSNSGGGSYMNSRQNHVGSRLYMRNATVLHRDIDLLKAFNNILQVPGAVMKSNLKRDIRGIGGLSHLPSKNLLRGLHIEDVKPCSVQRKAIRNCKLLLPKIKDHLL